MIAKSDDRKVKAFLAKAQAREDRERAGRVARIKRAIAGSDLMDHEIHGIETIVFGAFGRTRLGG
jgi:hypothetical protein